MAKHRSIGLRLHLGRHGITYALTGRVESEGRVRDTRLSYSTLPGALEGGQPVDAIAALQRVVWDLQRRHGSPPAAGGGPGAPGGGGGDTPAPPPPCEHDTIPLPGLHLVRGPEND